MANLLSISGVSLPVSLDSLSSQSELVGNVTRGQAGWRLMDRRREKQTFEFSLVPRALDEVQLYRELLLGTGEWWSMVASAFGSKGFPITGTGSWNAAAGGNPINSTGAWKATTGQTMNIPGIFYDQTDIGLAQAGRTGATVVGWRWDSSAYRIAAFSWKVGDSGPFFAREKLGSLGSSGASQAYTGTETFSTDGAGSLRITAPGAGGPWFWSNMRVIPWMLPSAQIDQLMDGLALITRTMPALPRVYVTSDLIPDGQLYPASERTSLVCHGELAALQSVPGAVGGSFDMLQRRLSGRLIEV